LFVCFNLLGTGLRFPLVLCAVRGPNGHISLGNMMQN
jgi:hypothetical protein